MRQTGGWLADGFLEGQWVEICQGSYVAGSAGCDLRAKIQVIRGTNPTFDNELELRYTPDRSTLGEPGASFEDSSPASPTASFTVTRIAAVATFTDTNWYQQPDDQARRRRPLRRADRT